MAEGGGTKFIYPIPESLPINLSHDDLVIIQNKYKELTIFHVIALSDSVEMKIPNNDNKTIESKVRATFEKAFWNILQESLDKDPPDYEHSLILLQEIKQNLMSLLLNGSESQQRKKRIDEVLDIELIQQQISHNVFNFQPYSDFIIDTMAMLCSPVRDEIIASLKNIKEIVPLYKKIYEVLNIMHVDFSNFEIKAMQPIIKSHSVEVERELFIDILNFQREKGIDGLLITKEWLKMNYLAMKKKQTDNISDNSNSSILKIIDVINAAYVDLLQREYYPLPETVALDKEFIDHIRKEISKISFISAVIALTRSIFSEQLINETIRKQLRDNLIILCQDFNPLDRDTWARGIGEHILDILKNSWTSTNSSQPSSNIPFFDENKKIDFISQIIAFIDSEKQHPILSLMINRLMTILLDVIDKSIQDVTLPIGFSLFSTELLDIKTKFRHVFGYNRKVFTPIYENLIKHLINNSSN